MTTDAGTPTPWPIEDVVARDLSGWARSLYNCTTGDNHLRTSEYYQLIRDLDAYEIVIAAAREQIATLTAAEAERDALRQAMGFAQGAIEDAIYTEDGLDGETGERVLHIMQEAVERGTFDQTQIGSLPRPMLETENDALRARVAELEAGLRFYADPDSYETHRQGGPVANRSAEYSTPSTAGGCDDLRDLLRRCRPIVQADAQMMADISRHAPLDPASQATHDTTEYESEKLLPLIDAALAGHIVEPNKMVGSGAELVREIKDAAEHGIAINREDPTRGWHPDEAVAADLIEHPWWPRLRAALLSEDEAREVADSVAKGAYSETMLKAAEAIGTARALRIQLATAQAELGEAREDAEEAFDLLETMYRLWENGTECYEDPEECAGLLGNAVWLDDITERKIADLLNEHRPAKSPSDEIDRARGGGDA